MSDDQAMKEIDGIGVIARVSPEDKVHLVDILRKKGHQVARDSNHTKGNAVDFYLPKIATMKLHAWAKDRKLGGVGLYLASGFVHMDTGPIRFWSGE